MTMLIYFVIGGIASFNANAISTVTIGSNSVGDNNWPSAWQPNAISTAIYTAGELNAVGVPNNGSTIISKISFNVLSINNTQTNPFNNVYILLRNTGVVNASQLTAPCGLVGLASLVNDQGFKIVKGPFSIRGEELNPGWNDIEFDTTFTYNGGYNLQIAVVSIDLQNPGNVNDFQIATYPAGTNSAFYSPFTHCRPSSSFPNQLQNIKPQIRLEIESNYIGQVYLSYNLKRSNVTVAEEGNQNVNILKVEIKMFGDVAPFNNLIQMVFYNEESSTIVTTAKLYYTGTSPNYNAHPDNLVAAVPINTNNIITFNGNVTLKNGTNYLWLVYDISNNIPSNGYIDVALTSFTFSRTGIISALNNPDENIYVKKTGTLDPLPLYNQNVINITSNSSIAASRISDKEYVLFNTMINTSNNNAALPNQLNNFKIKLNTSDNVKISRLNVYNLNPIISTGIAPIAIFYYTGICKQQACLQTAGK